MCTCRPCYLLFTDQQAELRYRAVPDRYLSFPGFALGQADWDDLQIPVGLAFLFRNSAQDRVVAFYPSPAGATESELSLDAWERVAGGEPGPGHRAARRRGAAGPAATRDGPTGFTCHVVPIDACYELVGRMRHDLARVRRRPGGARRARRVLRDGRRTAAARRRRGP